LIDTSDDIQTAKFSYARSVKLNYNEVEAYPKPLAFYLCIYMLESLAGLFLRVLGFDKYSQGEARFTGRTAENPATTYWCYIPESSTALDGNENPGLKPKDKTPVMYVVDNQEIIVTYSNKDLIN
jgi:hypothetical protein